MHEGTWKSSLSLYKTKYSSFKIFRWPADSEPPSAAVHSRGCSNSVGGGLCGQLPSPSASLYTQHKCSKMSLRTGDLTRAIAVFSGSKAGSEISAQNSWNGESSVLPGMWMSSFGRASALAVLSSSQGAFRSRMSVSHEIRVSFPDFTVHCLCALRSQTFVRLT